MDCVDESGDASIAYTGTINWGPIRLHYSSLLETTGELVKTKQTLRPQTEPKIDDDSLRWRPQTLKIDGEWQSDFPGIRETVFASDAGSIEWNCVMPCAQARIHHRVGFGYAECIKMTIAPWELPICSLSWGRFAAASDWVVWIDWMGDFTRRIVYRNGQIAATSLVEDRQIEFSDGACLVMDRSLVLRDGPLGTTILSKIPGVRKSFPARLLQVNECKWRSRGRFTRSGNSTVEGWVIHERVDWPK